MIVTNLNYEKSMGGGIGTTKNGCSFFLAELPLTASGIGS